MQRTFIVQSSHLDNTEDLDDGGGSVGERNGRRSSRFLVALCLALVGALWGSLVTVQTVHAQRQSERTHAVQETHVVQQGETLGQIAQRYGLDWQDLAQWNGISDASRVYSGQILVLDGSRGNSSWRPASSGANPSGQAGRGQAVWSNEVTASGTRQSSANWDDSNWSSSNATGGTHIVQDGETLVGIAQRYGVTPPQLVRANDLSTPPALYPGQELILPGNSGGAEWESGPQAAQQQNQPQRGQSETQRSWAAPASSGVQTPQAPTQAGKVILISIDQQYLWAFENGRLVLQTPVTTGRPGADTPTGTYDVLVKYSPYRFVSPYPPGHEFYYDPVDSNYSLRITWNGHHIHDAPWRSDFGPGTNLPHNNSSGQWATGSIGCVNVPSSAMAQLYEWADEGIQVTIQ